MKLTIGSKLGIGFGAVILLMIISAGVAYSHLSQMTENVSAVVDESFPALQACDDLLIGINHSMAATRSFLLLGEDPQKATLYKNERKEAWSNIDSAMQRMNQFFETSTLQADQQNFQLIKSNLELVRRNQQAIENIAQTPDNTPSYQMLFTQAIPRSEKMFDAVARLIDTEASQEPTPERRDLLVALASFRSTLAQSSANLRTYVLTGKKVYQEQFQAQWKENQAAYDKLVSQVSLLMGIQPQQWEELKRVREEYLPIQEQILTERGTGDWNKAQSLLEGEGVSSAIAIREAAESMKADAAQKVSGERTKLDDSASAVKVTLLGATVIALIIGTIVAVLLSQSISRGVQGLRDRLQSVAQGDLTSDPLPITSQDEIGELSASTNSMVTSLRKLLAETRQMTAEVATSSSEIAAASQQQVSSLNQTATSLNEITTTSEEFKTTMQEFADRARAVQEAADETAKRSSEGRGMTQDSASRIEQVRSNAVAAGESVLKLSEKMQRIGEITATVNEIAEQTKLLALNASIEAARAGEEGRGFAVVATQVRELANQSKEAAGRIESLISDTQKSMKDMVSKIEDGGRLSESSAETVRRVAHGFQEIAQAIDQTREAMMQIKTGAKQQELGINELVSSITEIDSSSKQSLVAAQQTQQEILSINQRIQALNASLSRFQL